MFNNQALIIILHFRKHRREKKNLLINVMLTSVEKIRENIFVSIITLVLMINYCPCVPKCKVFPTLSVVINLK